MSNLNFKLGLLVILGLLGVVVGGVEEHGDPKEHKREGGKSKSTLKHEQDQSFHNNIIKCFSIELKPSLLSITSDLFLTSQTMIGT